MNGILPPAVELAAKQARSQTMDTQLVDAAEAAEPPVPQLQGTTREERVESLWAALGH